MVSSVNDNFKLLRTMEPLKDGSEFEFEIYSLRADSWKHTKGLPGSLGLRFSSNVFVEGTSAVHFLAIETKPGDDAPQPPRIAESKSIVAFNFAGESFTVVPLPDQCVHPKAEPIVDLASLRGCLCFCQENLSVISVWMMKEYGVQESWVHLVSLDHNKIPLAYLDEDRKLLIASNDRFKRNDEILQCYDIGTKEVGRIWMSGRPRAWNFKRDEFERIFARFYIFARPAFPTFSNEMVPTSK